MRHLTSTALKLWSKCCIYVCGINYSGDGPYAWFSSVMEQQIKIDQQRK